VAARGRQPGSTPIPSLPPRAPPAPLTARLSPAGQWLGRSEREAGGGGGGIRSSGGQRRRRAHGGGGVARAHAHLGGGHRLPRHRLRLPRRRALPPLPRQGTPSVDAALTFGLLMTGFEVWADVVSSFTSDFSTISIGSLLFEA